MEARTTVAFNAYDLGTLSSLLRVCQTDLVLLDDKPPGARITSFVHDETLLCTLVTGSRLRGRFTLPVDWCLLGFLHSADPQESWCHGLPLEDNAMLSVMPGGMTEFALGADSRLTFLVLPVARFQAHVTRVRLGASEDLSCELPTLSGASHPLLQAYYCALGERIDAGEVQGDDINGLVAEHASAVAMGGSGRRHQYCARSRRVRYLIFRRAEDFMRSNLRRHIYTHELCAAAGVCERALRYAFEELVGISPVRYLSMLRLCEACRSLSDADAGRTSVKSIALSCGLWDLSRFADNYRRVFGELPRETLMRATCLPG